MRNILLCFIFSTVILSATGQQTVYHPFPEGNCYWREASSGYQCFQCCSDYQYILTGDTVIGEYTYSKIEHSGVMYSQDIWGNCTHNKVSFYRNYKGALRNDTENRKVYYVQPWTDFEEVLYDFNLNIGDTLPPSYINPLCCGIGNKVVGIDSVLVGAEYHRSYQIASIFDPNPFCSIIEGVGSTFGLFGSMGALIQPFEFGSDLLCMNIDGETVYPDFTVCELVTGIANQPIMNSLTIVPNPASDYATVTLNHSSDKAIFSLMNMQGQQILSSIPFVKECTVDIKKVNRGVCVVKVTTGSGSYYSKLVIQ